MNYQLYKKRIIFQRKCGSGWAHAIATAIQGTARKRGADKRILSAQQILSCADKSRGCKGGNIVEALEYIQEKGILAEKSFKYKGKKVRCPNKKKDNKNENNGLYFLYKKL